MIINFENVGCSCFRRQTFTDIMIYVFFSALLFLVDKVNVNIDPFENEEGEILVFVCLFFFLFPKLVCYVITLT